MSPTNEAADAGRGSLIGGLAAGLAVAFLVAWGIPALAVAVTPGYRFDYHFYSLLFVRVYHDVAEWFPPPGWPDCAFLPAIILAPLLGGAVFHLLWRRGVFWTAITFAASYSIAVLLNAGMERASTFGLRWSELIESQEKRQMLTLFALAAVMSTLGAWAVQRLGWVERLRRPLPDLDFGEPVFRSEGSATGELEATEIKALLEANNLKAIVLRDSARAGLPFIVCVGKKDVDRGRGLVTDFAKAELEAAEQAESELARDSAAEATTETRSS